MLRALQEAEAEATPEVREAIWKNFHIVAYIGFMYDELSAGWKFISIFYHAFCIVHQFLYAGIQLYTMALLIETNLLDAVVSINFSCLTYLSFLTMITNAANRTNVSLLMKAVHDGFYDYGGTLSKKEIDKRIAESNERRKFVTLSITGVISICIGSFFISAVIDTMLGYEEKEIRIEGIYQHGNVKAWFPFNATSQFSLETAVTLYMLHNVFTTGTTLMALNLFNILGALTIILQLNILKTAISSLESRAYDMYRKRVKRKIPFSLALHKDSHYVSCMNYCLAQTVQHHQVLIKKFGNYTSVMTYPLFFYVSFCAVFMATSAIGLQEKDASPSVKMMCFSLLVAQILTLGATCFGLGQISSISADLKNDLYFLNWYDYHPSTKKAIKIMLEKMKRPIVLKAGGLAIVNWELFANVMQGFYSYVNLYNLANGRK
ncbi:Odorant receptor [Nesidiocoris tenuis]|uniref:Odorant receptor n=1 Tax=Nesidiocoris tenuis TaxID=355587 RepID=A0ABN7AVM3_9HEMI|nr:Odorant receptor [Nesidiocoris tenuis]